MKYVAFNLVLLFGLLCAGCFSLLGRCANSINAESISPDGMHIAVVYERDCGATTDFSTIVNIRSRTEKFDSEKGVLFIVKGRHRIDVSWKDGGKLQLECKDCRSEDVFRRESVWNDIEILHVDH